MSEKNKNKGVIPKVIKQAAEEYIALESEFLLLKPEWRMTKKYRRELEKNIFTGRETYISTKSCVS